MYDLYHFLQEEGGFIGKYEETHFRKAFDPEDVKS